jgi:hypothetical protein
MAENLSQPDDVAQETMAQGVTCGDILRSIALEFAYLGPGSEGRFLRTPATQFINGARDIDFKVPAGHSTHAGLTILAWVVSEDEVRAWAVVDASEEFDPAASEPGTCGVVGGTPEDILSPDLLRRSVTRHGGAKR